MRWVIVTAAIIIVAIAALTFLVFYDGRDR